MRIKRECTYTRNKGKDRRIKRGCEGRWEKRRIKEGDREKNKGRVYKKRGMREE
jgi:hypothetical protein